MFDPQEIALEHFDKVVLLVAVGVLAYTGATSMGASKNLTGKIDADRKKITTHMERSKPKAEELLDRPARLADRLSGKQMASADSMPSWMLHRRPGVLTKEKAKAARATAKHYSVTEVKHDSSDRGKAKITWQKASDNDYVIVTNYIVQRRLGKDGEWEEIARLAEDQTSYTDDKLAARSEYYYRVISAAEVDRMSKRVQRDKMILRGEDTEKTSSETGPVTTERDVYLIPQSVTIKDLIQSADSKDKAYIYVYKYDQAKGAFLPKKGFNVTEGEEIGAIIKIGRKEIDYTTGATFVSCRREIGKGKHGQDIQVGVIKIKWKTGAEEEARTTDPKPAK
ncbi:MAG: fibronectin type III domain-containing protein [Planctomycetes bacterium]|nr:fibronectin type III domain-containing protein [Planctomycetota bacterium]